MARTKRTAKKAVSKKATTKKTVKKEDKVLKKLNKQLITWQVISVTLGAILILSLVINPVSVPKSQVASNTISLINKYLLQGQATAELTTITAKHGAYEINFTVNGRDYSSYVTKDGKVLFPMAINLDELTTMQTQTQTQTQIPKSSNPSALLFTMSFCPYGNQAENNIIPAINLLNNSIKVVPHYVIYTDYGSGYPDYCLDENNTYCSMHGINELKEDVRELCVYKYYEDKYWDFVKAINGNCTVTTVNDCWSGVANDLGINTTIINNCFNDEAITLLSREVELNRQYRVSGSPTLIINNATYRGQRTPESYKQALCSSFTSEPTECATNLSSSGATTTGSC